MWLRVVFAILFFSVISQAAESTSEENLADLSTIAYKSSLFLGEKQAEYIRQDITRIGKWGIARGFTPSAISLSTSVEAAMFVGGREDLKVIIFPHGSEKADLIMVHAPGIEGGFGVGGSVGGGVSIIFNANDRTRIGGMGISISGAIREVVGVGGSAFASVSFADAAVVQELLGSAVDGDFNRMHEATRKLLLGNRAFGVSVGWGTGVGSPAEVMAILGFNHEMGRKMISQSELQTEIPELLHLNHGVSKSGSK